MANGDQQNLVTNQQPIGQQQGLMTEEETVEQPKTLYETLCPDVVVKGSEWTADELRERDEIPDTIQVKVYPLVGDYSTTNTMEKIRNMGSCEKI